MQKEASLAYSVLVISYMIIAVSSDEVKSNTNVQHSVNTETVKIGNTKNKNFNIDKSNYQVTQVVLNVPKLHKTLRKTRPPTEEENAIKRKILEVYNQAREDFDDYSPAMEHLGRILEALNPKYIATERVVRAAYSDSVSSSQQEPIVTHSNGDQSWSRDDSAYAVASQEGPTSYARAEVDFQDEQEPDYETNYESSAYRPSYIPQKVFNTGPRKNLLNRLLSRNVMPRFKDQRTDFYKTRHQPQAYPSYQNYKPVG